MVSPSVDHQAGLTLGLGFSSPTKTTTNNNSAKQQQQVKLYDHEPSLTLSLSGETHQTVEKKLVVDQEPPCSVSVASSLSNVVSVKRERETASSDDLEIERFF
ncbi:Homeobox-leucine zipper protein HAT9 [Bienertia sinuspersici]